jgi:chemotaxis protein MotC
VTAARTIAACALALALGTAAWAKDGPKPVEMVRTLQLMQDQMARGSAAAQAGQARLVAHIAQAFLAADPETWKDPRYSRAALVYVMSGGSPDVARRLLELGEAVPLDASMLKGVLAYLEGRNVEAKQLLEPIDARLQHMSVAGPLALIQATLTVETDPAKAMRLLDVARLLAPGTLVEESALRRAVATAGMLGDRAKFRSLCEQYIRRFQDSVYADAFRAQFAALFLDLAPEDGEESAAMLDEMLATVRAEQRRRLYLSVARTALTRGVTGTAGYASDRAKELSGEDAQDAVLYGAAAAIFGDGLESAVAELARIDPNGLQEANREIRAAALSMGEQITAWPDGEGAAPAEGDTEPTARATLASVARARSAIAGVDALLGAPK